MFLGGFRSDMSGNKAHYIESWCVERGLASICLDYRGHGLSEGRFEDLTLSDWLMDARAVLETVSPETVVLVGSSMGGWIASLLARELAAGGVGAVKLAGLMGIAAAPDFTDSLADTLGDAGRMVLAATGIAMRPSRYGDGPYPITQALLDDGATQRIFDRPFAPGCPVRLIHGSDDADVPWQRSERLFSHLDADDAELVLVKNGDHRLSEPANLARIGELLGYLTDVDR